MSVQIQSQNPSVPAERNFPKTDRCFDFLEHIVERSETLIWKAKYLIFGIGFLLFLIYELAHFAKFLLKNWSG